MEEEEKKYLSVANNKELYLLGRKLSNKDFFEFVPEKCEAIAEDDKNNILVKITEYDLVKNPSLIMQATKKTEIREKVYQRLESLDQNTSDMYKILFTHFLTHRNSDDFNDKENNPNKKLVFIKIDDIHFFYRGLRGKNKESTIGDDQYNNYVQAIDILSNTKVEFNINQTTNAIYDKLKSLNWGSIEGFLINDTRWIKNKKNGRIDGIWYNLGLIGEAFLDHIPQINNRYPKDLLKLNYNVYSTVKNIGEYLCWLHRCNKNANNKKTKLNFYNLMGECRCEIKQGRTQRSLDSFVKNLNKAKDILIENKIISDMKVPNVYSKNYRNSFIVISWIYE
jgi:hypothetical protein